VASIQKLDIHSRFISLAVSHKFIIIISSIIVIWFQKDTC